MKKTVLVLSNAEDDSTRFVTEHFNRLGTPYVRFNTETFPAEAIIALYPHGNAIEGYLQLLNAKPIDISDIQSVWYRRPIIAVLPEAIPKGNVEFIQRESNATLWSLYTTLDAFWMNPPLWSSKLLEANKLLQLKIARGLGLQIPETVVGNDPEKLLELAMRHGGRIAAKSLRAGMFLKENDQRPHFLFTQIIESSVLEESGEAIRICPFIGQEYVPKLLELRITVVGEQVFSCAIHSQDSSETTIDWRRYDFSNVKHEKWNLPVEIERKLVALLKQFHLAYGAIDMILTPDGEYVFLEINPNGQWTWIEELTGMPISQAMAEMLSIPPLDN